MALTASDTDKNPRAIAYVDGSGNPVLASATAPFPVYVLSEGAADSTPGTPVTTRVSSTTASQALLATNTARRGVTLWNDDANTARVLFEPEASTGIGTASSTVYTLAIPTNTGAYISGTEWTGRLSAIWDTDGSGGMQITVVT